MSMAICTLPARQPRVCCKYRDTTVAPPKLARWRPERGSLRPAAARPEWRHRPGAVVPPQTAQATTGQRGQQDRAQGFQCEFPAHALPGETVERQVDRENSLPKLMPVVVHTNATAVPPVMSPACPYRMSASDTNSVPVNTAWAFERGGARWRGLLVTCPACSTKHACVRVGLCTPGRGIWRGPVRWPPQWPGRVGKGSAPQWRQKWSSVPRPSAMHWLQVRVVTGVVGRVAPTIFGGDDASGHRQRPSPSASSTRPKRDRGRFGVMFQGPPW